MAADVAEPEVKVTVPREVTPSKNSTVPVAIPAPGETAPTVAVKVTDSPNTEGVVEANVVVVLALLTTWLTAELVLVTKLESPEYSAVMLFEPTASDAMDKVAAPDVRVPVPMMLEPFLKVTVPEAVPAPGAVAATFAVKVTDSPKTEGVVEANVVVVLALLTTWLTAELVLVTKLESPPYSAVMLLEATASDAMDKVATPDVRVPVPMMLEPFLKVTVPEAVPAPGETATTVAVKVTD